MACHYRQLAAIAAIVVELGGGLMVIVELESAVGPLPRCLFYRDGRVLSSMLIGRHRLNRVQNQMIHFMKNISMMGGLLYVVVRMAVVR